MMPSEFWKLTLAEFMAIVEGYKRKQTIKSNEIISLAWYAEALARTKKLPELKSLLQTNESKKARVQTADEMMSMCRLLNAAFGGSEIETG